MKAKVSEYAASENISRQAVYDRLKRTGVKARNGVIDVDALNAKWARIRDDVQGARNPAGTKKPEAPTRKPATVAGELTRPQRDDSRSEAQRVKEWLSVKAAKLAVEQAEGKLVSTEAVESERAETGIKVRDAVMGLTSSVCNRLPEEWRRQVSGVLGDEARKLLISLSDELRSSPTP